MAGISRLVRECLGDSRRREIFRELPMRRPEAHRTRWLTAEEIQRPERTGTGLVGPLPAGDRHGSTQGRDPLASASAT